MKTRVVVYKQGRIYQCHPAKTTWLCGCCGQGELGPEPMVGDYCPQCAAKVEEVL